MKGKGATRISSSRTSHRPNAEIRLPLSSLTNYILRLFNKDEAHVSEEKQLGDKQYSENSNVYHKILIQKPSIHYIKLSSITGNI